MGSDENEGLTFVRREYYIEPPQSGSAPEVWAQWLKDDSAKARAHKAQYTKASKHAPLPESADVKSWIKKGGVYRQSSLVGFVGGSEDHAGQVEAVVEADQERVVEAREMAILVVKPSRKRKRRHGKKIG
jgi:hypothetical protein